MIKQYSGFILSLLLGTCSGGAILPSSISYNVTATTLPTSITGGLSLDISPSSIPTDVQETNDSDHPDVSYQNVSISYFEYGNPENPTIIITGGWPWDSSVYDIVAKWLASDGFHVLRYDQRGSGKSGHPSDESMYSLPDLANELGALIDARAPGKPITVFGEAWAPFIGSEYACTYPGRIKSIVSIGAPSFDLSQNSLNKAMKGILTNPLSLPSVAKQMAALSYFFLLDVPIIPQYVFDSGIPTFLVNAITTLIDDPIRLFQEDPSFLKNSPTHKADYADGSYKYKWIVNNRMLKKPKWDYLPVENLKVFQMNQDVIEGPILINDLQDHTPNLNLTHLNGGHLTFGININEIYSALTEYARRAQN